MNSPKSKFAKMEANLFQVFGYKVVTRQVYDNTVWNRGLAYGSLTVQGREADPSCSMFNNAVVNLFPHSTRCKSSTTVLIQYEIK